MRKLAIHHRPGSFSDQWISYCEMNSIAYCLVDCFRTDIIEQLDDCWGLMWHWSHSDFVASLFARQLTISLENKGISVFPNTFTSFHYDDKLGQKYLLESIDAPLVPSYVFYSEQEAFAWAQSTSFPKVWKLRGGAGSQNVRLIDNLREAENTIAKSFSRGWRPARFHALRERLWHFSKDKNILSFLNITKGLYRAAIPHRTHRQQPVQIGYVYFQDFIPDNDHDIRVVVIGDRAFAIKRHTRANDFRASGSGNISYDPDVIPLECVRLGFDLTEKLKAQCLAYDFVMSASGPLVVEISYAYTSAAYRSCPGYWNRTLDWVESDFHSEHFMIEDLLANTGE